MLLIVPPDVMNPIYTSRKDITDFLQSEVGNFSLFNERDWIITQGFVTINEQIINLSQYNLIGIQFGKQKNMLGIPEHTVIKIKVDSSGNYSHERFDTIDLRTHISELTFQARSELMEDYEKWMNIVPTLLEDEMQKWIDLVSTKRFMMPGDFTPEAEYHAEIARTIAVTKLATGEETIRITLPTPENTTYCCSITTIEVSREEILRNS